MAVLTAVSICSGYEGVGIGLERAGEGDIYPGDELPGSFSETTNRVSELMIVGNGVVPETVALAWKTLFTRIEKK